MREKEVYETLLRSFAQKLAIAEKGENAKRFLKEESIENVMKFIEEKKKEFEHHRFYCLALLLIGRTQEGLEHAGLFDDEAREAFCKFRVFLRSESAAA